MLIGIIFIFGIVFENEKIYLSIYIWFKFYMGLRIVWINMYSYFVNIILYFLVIFIVLLDIMCV